MSSILKALKRIEVQSSHSDSAFTQPETNGTMGANKTITRRRWFIPGVIIVSLVLIIIAAAAIIRFNRSQPVITKKLPTGVSANRTEISASSLEKSNIFRAKIPPKSTTPAGSVPKKAQLAKNQTRVTASADAVKETPGKAPMTMAKAPVNQPASKPPSTVPGTQPGTAAGPKGTPQKRSALKDRVDSKKSAAVKSFPSGKPATKAKKPDRTKTYDRMDDSKLKLQALAWFNDASKRMAVINSRIVREGGSVDGYQVTQIRRQDVVVSDGKKSWRLEFGLKQ